MSMDPNAGPAIPPQLAALLGGGGAGPDPSQGGGMGPSQSDPSQSGSDSEGSSDLPNDPVALLQSMIAAAKKYLEVEPDEEDKLTMTGVLQKLQQYLAKDQKDGEQMLGGTISPRAVRKAGAPSGP